VSNAIAELQLGGGTAIGEAIYSSLGTLAATPQPANGSPSPARIVLMSDGATNSGRSNDEAAQAAAAAHVPITTIAYGTDGGQLTMGGRVYDVPVDKAALQKIADQTGGKYFEAASSSQLKQVYDAIRTSVSYRIRYHDLSAWFLGGGLVVFVMAAAASLLWSPLVP
jgi:Ca-activated chloride channel family protein